MRLAYRIDDLYRELLMRAEYREQVAAARPGVTGFVSDCCRASTDETRAGDLRCVECGRRCESRSWHSPLSGGASKGGWNPSARQQLMYINETRVRSRAATDDRQARGADRVIALSRLIENLPRGWFALEWNRSLLAWRRWLYIGNYEETAAMSVEFADEDPEVWTGENVRRWVYAARAVVIRRLKQNPKRYRWVAKVA